MLLPFNEAKATQAASRLLRAAKGKMNYLKLIKLLYLADREALIEWGRPITTDRYVSMEHGPVVIRIYDLIMAKTQADVGVIWGKHISKPRDYKVSLVEDAGGDELSRAEEALLDKVFKRHKARDRQGIVDYVHRLPEWRDPKLTGKKLADISIRDILKAAGKTDEEITAIEEELKIIAAVSGLISR